MAKASTGPVSLVTSRRPRCVSALMAAVGATACACTPASSGNGGESPVVGSGQEAHGGAHASAPMAAIGQRIVIDQIAITPLAVVEDSRCPQDVDCAWPGRVVLHMAIDRAGIRSEHDIVDYEGPVQVGDTAIDLVGIEPLRTRAARDIAVSDYRFAFSVTRTRA